MSFRQDDAEWFCQKHFKQRLRQLRRWERRERLRLFVREHFQEAVAVVIIVLAVSAWVWLMYRADAPPPFTGSDSGGAVQSDGG